MAGCFKTTAFLCGEQAAGRKQAHVLYREFIVRKKLPRSTWSYHELLHVCTLGILSFGKCLSLLVHVLYPGRALRNKTNLKSPQGNKR